jgi:hypothetical protein
MTPEAPPADLVPGEGLLWKMADVKGVLVRRVITGYMVTNFRCFVWDAERNVVRVNVPVSQANVKVEGKRSGKRTIRGGSFVVPKTADYLPPAMGEIVEMGDIVFRVEEKSFMIFRDVAEPSKVESLINLLKSRIRVPVGLGVDLLWKADRRELS